MRPHERDLSGLERRIDAIGAMGLTVMTRVLGARFPEEAGHAS